MSGHLLDVAQRRQYAHGHRLVDERRTAGRHIFAEQQAFDELELDGFEQGEFGSRVALLGLQGLGDHEQRGEFFRVSFRAFYDAHAFLDRFQHFVAHLSGKLNLIGKSIIKNTNLHDTIACRTDGHTDARTRLRLY